MRDTRSHNGCASQGDADPRESWGDEGGLAGPGERPHDEACEVATGIHGLGGRVSGRRRFGQLRRQQHAIEPKRGVSGNARHPSRARCQLDD